MGLRLRRSMSPTFAFRLYATDVLENMGDCGERRVAGAHVRDGRRNAGRVTPRVLPIANALESTLLVVQCMAGILESPALR